MDASEVTEISLGAMMGVSFDSSIMGHMVKEGSTGNHIS